MNRTRIEIVKTVLRTIPDSRTNQKLLCCEVWKKEGCFTLDDVIKKGSAPAGILRDRTRAEVKAEFPLGEESETNWREYRDEFSEHVPYQSKEVFQESMFNFSNRGD